MYLTKAPALPPWPNGSLVGYENYPGYTGSLIDGSAITVQSNTTYTGYLNLGDSGGFGSLGTQGNPVSNVTFIGCCWAYGGPAVICALLYGTNFTFINCTFQPGPFASYPPSAKELPVPQANGPQYGLCADGTPQFPGTYNTFVTGGLRIVNCDFWGFGNGGARLANGSSVANPYRVDYSYFHNLRLNTDTTDHQDGIGAPGGGGIDGLILTRCSVNAAGDTNAIIWGPSDSPVTNCQIIGNLVGGYGFTVALFNDQGQLSNLTFAGNTFSTQLQCFFGPLYDQTLLSSPGFTWKGNRWLVPPGAYWGHSAYNGYYWLPGYTSNASPSFDELAHGLVGTSDFM